MAIYTKTGDGGQASLPDGARISKGQPIFEVLGNIDELNSCLGICLSFMGKEDTLQKDINYIQSILLTIGAILADPNHQIVHLSKVNEAVTNLEKRLDQWEQELPKIRNFIQPSGTPLASHLHFCRAITRKAERSLNRIYLEKSLAPISIFLNRLSDYCFQAARQANHQENQKEIEWKLI